jgi:hypothetical protein
MKVRTDVGARHELISAYPVRHYLDAPLSVTHCATGHLNIIKTLNLHQYASTFALSELATRHSNNGPISHQELVIVVLEMFLVYPSHDNSRHQV